MNKQLLTVILAVAGYTVTTFILAAAWHVGLFESQYQSFGYFNKEPNFALGFLSIFLQGVLLSGFYAFLTTNRHLSIKIYLGVMGGFFWTSHVLAFIAKQEVEQVVLFVIMESMYLMLQFGCYGFILRRLYHRST